MFYQAAWPRCVWYVLVLFPCWCYWWCNWVRESVQRWALVEESKRTKLGQILELSSGKAHPSRDLIVIERLFRGGKAAKDVYFPIFSGGSTGRACFMR